MFEKKDPTTNQSMGNAIIDAILKEGRALTEADDQWHEGYSAHSDGWLDYTDHADYTEK